MKDLNNVKVVQIGCGKMSRFTMRYVLENHGQIVGAFDISPNIIGKDIGEIIETDNVGVVVQSFGQFVRLSLVRFLHLVDVPKANQTDSDRKAN